MKLNKQYLAKCTVDMDVTEKAKGGLSCYILFLKYIFFYPLSLKEDLNALMNAF